MNEILNNKETKRFYGEHFTPIELFKEYIFPWIKDNINEYVWIDLYAGEGNLILPILDYIEPEKKIEFFKNNIYMFEIQKENFDKLLLNTMAKGIPEDIAKKNIFLNDTIKNYPIKFLKKFQKPVFHITNPPYLYLGYIVKNKERFKTNFEYFNDKSNEGYQDLYQLALINDLRNKIYKMIYIIPSNFLFGASVSNKIRKDFFQYYTMNKAIIFEKEIFEFTGTNVVVCNFTRKNETNKKDIIFNGVKINCKTVEKKYILKYKNSYRAGNELSDFLDLYTQNEKIKFSFYLEEKTIINGNKIIDLLDANKFENGQYVKTERKVNDLIYNTIKNNILFIRTVDTGSQDGRAGLYITKQIFDCDGILVTKSKFRTHPIQIFFEENILIDEQKIIKDYFNLILEYLREITDSEFMTSYKYSNSEYVRKYLGLTQAKKILETYPIKLSPKMKVRFSKLITEKNANKVLDFLNTNCIGEKSNQLELSFN
ncbi:MAG TPA: N-6 DNA methylase [bacterium]|nr:N-6 DNA methylase [bacterium]